MTTQNLTLRIPARLYHQLQERANRRNHSVEDETLDLLASAVPDGDALPTDIADAVAPLTLLSNDDLWRAARSHFPATSAAKLERLHRKQQRDGLTIAEQQKAAALVRQYERNMLVRAKAAQLLHERGLDITELAPR